VQYRGFLAKKKNSEDDRAVSDNLQQEPSSSLLSPSCKTPQTLQLELSQKTSPVFLSNKSFRLSKSPEQRAEEIQKKIESKIFLLKSSFEKKKLKQLINLNHLELEREKKNKKILDRLVKHHEFSSDRTNNSFENNMKKFDSVRKNLEKQEHELEKNIKKSLDKIELKHKMAQKKLELDLISKKIKAKQMTKSVNFDKTLVEGAQSEGRLKILMEKFEKMSENKKKIRKIIEFRMQKKKDLEKIKKKKFLNIKKIHEEEEHKKNLEIEKKSKNNEKVLKKKQEKMKAIAVQNELEHLSAQTRITRLQTKMVKYI
jgi:hypothetical protein